MGGEFRPFRTDNRGILGIVGVYGLLICEPLPIAACQPHPVAKPRGPPRPRHRTQTRTFMNVEFELVDSVHDSVSEPRSVSHSFRVSRSHAPRVTVTRTGSSPAPGRPPRARAPRPGLPAFAVPASRRSALPGLDTSTEYSLPGHALYAAGCPPRHVCVAAKGVCYLLTYLRSPGARSVD